MYLESPLPWKKKGHVGICLLLLLFWMELDETLGCPFLECICHRGEIYCAELDYRSVPEPLPETRSYDTLDLGGNRLRRIRAKAFANITVKKIKIRHNKRQMDIHKKAFRGMEDVLEVLHITRSHVSTLPSSLFK